MDYLVYWFLSKMPCCLEKKMLIDGKEEVCLVLPTKVNQIKKGKQGNWLMISRLMALPPNEKAQTHEVQLTYLTEEELQKSYDYGYHRRTRSMGRVYEHMRGPGKKLDRTNTAGELNLEGRIILSDIPGYFIFRNSENAKRYVKDLRIQSIENDGRLLVGSICLDDIDNADIETDHNTGKKYINARLSKLPILDTYMNTHTLAVVKADGTTYEIGKFKEFRDPNFISPTINTPEEDNRDKSRDMPDYIQGIKF